MANQPVPQCHLLLCSFELMLHRAAQIKAGSDICMQSCKSEEGKCQSTHECRSLAILNAQHSPSVSVRLYSCVTSSYFSEALIGCVNTCTCTVMDQCKLIVIPAVVVSTQRFDLKRQRPDWTAALLSEAHEHLSSSHCCKLLISGQMVFHTSPGTGSVLRMAI